jgi:hypothetical protein
MKDGDTPNVTRYDSPAAGKNFSHTIGEPAPASFDGKPRGYTVGHAVGDPLPASLNGKPRGYTAGHAVGDPLPPSLDGKPRGYTAGRAVGARSTTPTERERQGRSPRDRANAWPRDAKPTLIKRPA